MLMTENSRRPGQWIILRWDGHSYFFWNASPLWFWAE